VYNPQRKYVLHHQHLKIFNTAVQVVEKGDWQERKKQKAQQAEEVQKLVDSIGTIDYCHRLIHLFQIRRPPTLSHFHMLVKKV